MKAVVATFNQEKALVEAFSVITNLRMELFEALTPTHPHLHLLMIVVCYISTFIHNMVQIDFMVSDIYGVRKS